MSGTILDPGARKVNKVWISVRRCWIMLQKQASQNGKTGSWLHRSAEASAPLNFSGTQAGQSFCISAGVGKGCSKSHIHSLSFLLEVTRVPFAHMSLPCLPLRGPGNAILPHAGRREELERLWSALMTQHSSCPPACERLRCVTYKILESDKCRVQQKATPRVMGWWGREALPMSLQLQEGK